MRGRALALATTLATAACGGAPRGGGGTGGPVDFECKDRRAFYAMTGSIMYAEQGVRMTCDGDVPWVEEYYIDDRGQEKRRRERITASGWEKAWRAFESAGWRRLSDCDNPTAGPKDPVYTFEISDGQKTVSFVCPGVDLPFPFDQLRAALDEVKAELPLTGVDD